MKLKLRVGIFAGGRAVLAGLGLVLGAAGWIRAADPVANPDTATTTEDTMLVVINALANDSISNGPATTTFNTSGTLGSVTDAGNGVFHYNPFSAFQHLKTGDSATDSFTYTITDTNDASDSATVTITITGVNDAPSFTGMITTNQMVNDNATVRPFSGASVVDPDLPVQSVRVVIELSDDRPGTFTGSAVGTDGFVQGGLNNERQWTLNNVTPATATLKIQDLVYTPVSNRLPVDQSTNVQFTITATTVNSTDSLSGTNRATVVRIVSVNDPPVITGTVIGPQLVFNGGSLRPFSEVVLTDADRGSASDGGQGLRVGITLTGNANGTLLLGTTDFTRSNNVYTLSVRSQGEATRHLQALVYQAQAAAVDPPVNTFLALSVTDNYPPAVEDTNTLVRTATPFVTPDITGVTLNQTVDDDMPILPFETVSLLGTGSKVQIRLLQASDLSAGADMFGELIQLNGFGKADDVAPSTNKVYTFTGTLEEATTAIRGVAFQPVENLLSQRTKVVFEISLYDANNNRLGRDTRTTVEVVPVNDLPTILGAEPSLAISDKQTVQPFLTRATPAPALVLVQDPDESGLQPMVVTVELDLPNQGIFTAGSLGVITNAGPGFYRGRGTPSEVSTALRRLVFQPTPNRLFAGQEEEVRFHLVLDDQQGQGTVENDQSSVIVQSLNDPPQIALNGTNSIIADIGAGDIKPFRATTIVDPDAGSQTLRVTILVDTPSKGSFSSLGGFTNLPTYTFIGTASEATASIQNLIFNPNRGFGGLSGSASKQVSFAINARDDRNGLAVTNLTMQLIGHNRTWLVTSTNDSGPGTLRQAVADAQSNDSIAFNITNNLPVVLRVASEIVLDKNLTLYGPGADKLSLSGDADGNGIPDNRIFRLANEAQVSMCGLTVTRGRHAFSGGAISVGPNCWLVMSYCAVTHSTAGVWGGGIDVDQGALSLAHCLVYSNAVDAALGQGGGGVCLYTDWACGFENTTFSANRQAAQDGFGGGGLYIENLAIGIEFPIDIISCTFKDNADASGTSASIHASGFNALAFVQNTIVANPTAPNLSVEGGALILSLGGNISDDDTITVFSQGGAPVDVLLFDHPSDQLNIDPLLAPLALNGGPTATHALLPGSLAIASAFGSAPAIDQRGAYRPGPADVGAYETTPLSRVVLNEVLFNATGGRSGQYLEFYNPRDSQTTSLTGFTVWIDDIRRHTFGPVTLPPGVGLMVAASAGVFTPAGVPRQNASTGGLNLDTNTSFIVLKNAQGQDVLSVTYNGVFAPADLPLLDESITLSPEFMGWALVPHSLAPDSDGVTSSPGTDTAGAPLTQGNAPPRAFADNASVSEDQSLDILVLANDVELDQNDLIRVISVTTPSALDARVTINNTPRVGASVNYDPQISPTLQALPVGATAIDTFSYRIIDCCDPLFGTDWPVNGIRYTNSVSVRVTGVNDLPIPRADTATTFESVPLVILGDQLLDNDDDPDSDDDKTTLFLSAVHMTALQENSAQAFSALGAFVELEVRFNRHETRIHYDPSVSDTLNALAVGETTVDTFYYSVVDRHGAVGSAAVSVTVHGQNDGPVAVMDMLRTEEDKAITVPASAFISNDQDVDTTDVLRLAPATFDSTMGARVQISLSGMTYNPVASSNLNALARKEIAVDTFRYTLLDGEGGMSTAEVHVTVTGVNDQPIANADTGQIDEDTVLTVGAPGLLANDRELDRNGLAKEDPLRVLAFTNATTLRGALVSAQGDGSFSYDPRGVFDYLATGQVTNDTFSYTIVDDSLTIANDDQFSVLGGTEGHLLRVLANDVTLTGSGGILGIVGMSLPDESGGLMPTNNGTAFLYSPRPNFFGIETFSYAIEDGQGGVDTAWVTVRVIKPQLNGNLTAQADAFTVARGTTVDLDVLVNDPILPNTTTDFLILDVGPTDSGGVATVNTDTSLPTVRYTPDRNTTKAFPYFETFTYTITGGGEARATGTIQVKVLDRRNALTANNDFFSVMANGGTNTLEVLANDKVLPGGDSAIVIAGIDRTGMAGTVNTNTEGNRLLYRPPPGILSGSDNWTYVIADGGGGTATGRVQVAFAQSGFIANADVVTVARNSRSNVLAVLRNDTILPYFGQNFTITVIGIGANAPNRGGQVWIHPTQKTLYYSPSNNFAGEETFTYEISDGTLARAEGRVTVKVIDRAGVVSANADVYAVQRASRSNILAVLHNDNVLPRSEEIPTITSVQQGNRGGIVGIDRSGPIHTLRYTPQTNFVGEETFTYQVADARGGTGSATVRVQVGYFTLGPDDFSALSGSLNNELDVLANDLLLPDTNSLRVIAAVGVPDRGGTVVTSAARNRLLYSPRPGFVGIETFPYTMADDSGGTTTALASLRVYAAGSDRHTAPVEMTVVGVNDPPVISNTSTNAITDKETVNPFPNVVITELDDHGLEPVTVTVTLDAARGFLTSLDGFARTGPGTYSFTGTAAAATLALRGLVYDPIENRIVVPTSETTVFTISVDDGFVSQPVTDSSTTVTVTAVNDPPIISGTVSNLTVYHRLTLRPFAGVTITEVDDSRLQPLRITVTVSDPTHGVFTALGDFVAAGPGVYTLGTAGAGVTAAAASVALRNLVFAPTTDTRVTPGSPETTGFRITVEDGFASPVIDDVTSVIAIHEFVTKLLASDGGTGDQLGHAVAALGDVVVVGAPFDDDRAGNAGAAYVYMRTRMLPDHWVQAQKLVPADGAAGDGFGSAVAISGNTIAVGAPFDRETHAAGSVYLYQRSSSGSSNWVQITKVVPADGANGDEFGGAVSLDQDTLVVGSRLDDEPGTSAGSAYVFGRNHGGTQMWGQVKKLRPQDHAAGDEFGRSVSVNGDLVAVGSPLDVHNLVRTGSAHLFSRNEGGSNLWGQVKKLVPSDGLSADEFGCSVSLDADVAVVGARAHDMLGNDTGAAYVYQLNRGAIGAWGEAKKLVATMVGNNDQFGYTVSVDRNKVVVGAPFAGFDNQSRFGAAYAYERNVGGPDNWGVLQKLDRSDPENNDQFGWGIAIGQDTVVVGVNMDDDKGGDAGSFYLYRLKYNNAPLLVTPIPDQTALTNTPFLFAVPGDTFGDPDVGDRLLLSAALAGAPGTLPPWLTFDASLGEFSGTPLQVGSFAIQLTATDEDQAAVTYLFNILVVDTPAALAASALDLWRTRIFGAAANQQASLSGDEADPDQDGLSNRLEFFFGTDPLDGSPADARSAFWIDRDATPGHVLVHFRYRSGDPQFTCSLETSSDLATWTSPGALAEEVSRNSMEDGIELVTVRIRLGSVPADRRFFRVKVNSP